MKPTLTEQEIIADFWRFVRHEAMRANVKQESVKKLVERELVVDYFKNKQDNEMPVT